MDTVCLLHCITVGIWALSFLLPNKKNKKNIQFGFDANEMALLIAEPNICATKLPA